MSGELHERRFAALDAWRGISAILVALEHLNVDNVLHKNALVHHGYRFVDFFFVLSGFVIAHSYRERLQQGWAQVRSFALRRIGRLWPLHLVMLAAFIVFEVAVAIGAKAGLSLGHDAFTDRNTVAGIAANLVLIQGLGIFQKLTWNTVSWSISTEMFAYGLFAAVCWLIPRRWISVAAAILMTAGAAVIVLVAPKGMGSTYDFGVFRCVFGFMAGVLARSAWGRFQLRWGTAGEVLVLIAIAASVCLLPLDAPALLVTPMFVIAVWVFASEDGALSRALVHRIPQALGRWSYSIYMIHVMVALVILTTAMLASRHGAKLFTRMDDVVTIIGPVWLTTAIIVAYVALVLGLASLSYRWIEVPGQRWFRARAPARDQTSSSLTTSPSRM